MFFFFLSLLLLFSFSRQLKCSHTHIRIDRFNYLCRTICAYNYTCNLTHTQKNIKQKIVFLTFSRSTREKKHFSTSDFFYFEIHELFFLLMMHESIFISILSIAMQVYLVLALIGSEMCGCVYDKAHVLLLI